MEIMIDLPEQILLKKGGFIFLKPDISEEEFWEISNEDTNYELIDGVLVIHSPATVEHEDIFRYLNRIISFYFDETKKGKIFGSRLVMRLSKKWNPEPDLIILLPKNYNKIKKSRIEGAADIVIEILSKSTKKLDLNEKLPEYLKAGVGEVWIIDPESRTISIHQKDAIKEYSDENSNEFIESNILPGLQIQVAWIWHREKFLVNTIMNSKQLAEKDIQLNENAKKLAENTRQLDEKEAQLNEKDKLIKELKEKLQ